MAKNQKKERKTCVIYTRVSTAIQVDGYSLKAQEEVLRAEAAHRGYEVLKVYPDEGKSGKNIKGRPRFQEMLDDIQNPEMETPDYVYVFKLSRFGRNAADTLSSLQFLEDYGVNLLAVEDSIDSAGTAGKLLIAVYAAVAEAERENIQAQTMAGRWQKAKEGGWNGGFASYGYKLVEGNLVIAEDEAELVREIYKMFTESSIGMNAIAKRLNNRGLIGHGGSGIPVDYDYFPRGRVVYRKSDDTFIIYHDRCVTDKIERVADRYRGYNVRLELDEHYCCHRCNPDYAM